MNPIKKQEIENEAAANLFARIETLRENLRDKNQHVDLELGLAAVNNRTKHLECILASLLLLLIVAIIGLIAMSAVEVAYGTTYRHELDECPTSVMSLSTWLIVDGAFTLSVFGLTVLQVVCCGKEGTSNDSPKNDMIAICSQLFSIAWCIVGAITFWGQCFHTSPMTARRLIEAVLIIRFIALGLMIIQKTADTKR